MLKQDPANAVLLTNNARWQYYLWMFPGRFSGRRYRLYRTVLLYFIIGFIVFIVYSIYKRSAARKPDIQTSAQMHLAQLPPDVDFVLKDFNYREDSEAGVIEITGKLSAMRGRKIMVFRSNLDKATYFELLEGTIRSRKHTIAFSADNGEWDNRKTTPFVLNRNVRLTVDNKPVDGVETLRLDMAGQQVIAAGKQIIRFTY